MFLPKYYNNDDNNTEFIVIWMDTKTLKMSNNKTVNLSNNPSYHIRDTSLKKYIWNYHLDSNNVNL